MPSAMAADGTTHASPGGAAHRASTRPYERSQAWLAAGAPAQIEPLELLHAPAIARLREQPEDPLAGVGVPGPPTPSLPEG